MESGKKTSIIVWTGLAAAATGIVAVAVMGKLRERAARTAAAATRLRDAQEVLEDCYRKVREIEEHLPKMLSTGQPARSVRKSRQAMTNGSPMVES